MSPSSKARKHGKLFRIYLERLEEDVTRLHAKVTSDIDTRVSMYRSTWENACRGYIAVSGPERFQFAGLLGRVAESYSLHHIAEEVFDQLAEEALQNDSDLPNPVDVLITAGEFNRRRAHLSKAEERFAEAKRLLEHKLLSANDPVALHQIHRQLGRVFYELAYVDRCRGDAGSAASHLERCEMECDLGQDPVGASIARTLRAVLATSLQPRYAGNSRY